MGVKDDILMVLDARAVADSLKEADLDTLVELDEVLSKTTSDKIGQFMLQVIFELLPPEARELLAAQAEVNEPPDNVISLFTRRPIGEDG